MRENLKDARMAEYRQEVIAAAERVFGPRVKVGGCLVWWLGEMRERLAQIRSETPAEKPF
jgi:hypothetical protein